LDSRLFEQWTPDDIEAVFSLLRSPLED
jgi:hypothetical protein